MKREREYTKFKKKKRKKLRETEVMQGSKKERKKRPINFKTFKLISSEKIRYWVHETTVSSFKRSNEETKERLEFKNYKR